MDHLAVVLRSFPHQVAGHVGRILHDVDDSRVFKALATRELGFYQWCSQNQHLGLLEYMPKLYGIASLQRNHEHDPQGMNEDPSTSYKVAQWRAITREHFNVGSYPIATATSTTHEDYIVLDDVTAGYLHPCVIDCKLGTRTYGLDETAAKRQKQELKQSQTTSASLGLRLCGCRTFSHTSGSYRVIGKYEHRALTRSTITAELRRFFHTGTRLQTEAVEECLASVKALQARIARIDGLRLWGSSVLLVFDAGSNDGNHCDVSQGHRTPVDSTALGTSAPASASRSRVVMIDFAHTYPPSDTPTHMAPATADANAGGSDALDDSAHEDLARLMQGPDTGYLLGLRSLAEALQQVLDMDAVVVLESVS